MAITVYAYGNRAVIDALTKIIQCARLSACLPACVSFPFFYPFLVFGFAAEHGCQFKALKLYTSIHGKISNEIVYFLIYL